MKNILIAVVISFLGSSVFAQNASSAHFAEHKEKVVARIQARIAKEQAMLACVQAAQNHEAIKSCMPTRHN
jgi:hypothetical protein